MVPRVYFIIYDASGRWTDSCTTERSIAPRLVYTASLDSSWDWLDLLRLRTSARFLVWGRLYLERLGPSEMVGQAFEYRRPRDLAYRCTICHPGIILVDIGLRAQGFARLIDCSGSPPVAGPCLPGLLCGTHSCVLHCMVTYARCIVEYGIA